jgi:type IV secretion system protein TrbG
MLSCTLALVGCAGAPEIVKAPPLANDLVQWTAPVTEASTEARPAPTEEPREARSPREKVYEYIAGEVYAITVPMGAPLDIVLQPGERVHNLVGGDRSPAADAQDASPPWDVKEGSSGAGLTARPHVFVAVTKPGLRMGLAITTTKRTYYLELRSVGRSPVRSMRWTYPEETAVVAKTPPRLLPDPA